MRGFYIDTICTEIRSVEEYSYLVTYSTEEITAPRIVKRFLSIQDAKKELRNYYIGSVLYNHDKDNILTY